MQQQFITSETVLQWLDDDEAILVDVREPEERAIARIDRSHALPLSCFVPDALPNHDGKKIILHCASGIRCGLAAEKIIQSGYSGTIYRLQGGIEDWYASGNPVMHD
tara:strand:+ start:95 stop:415 length:321 start_codon:yes stop_codon:yes gene_type:complete